MREISEATVRDAAQGSVEAFEAIYKAYGPYVYNVVYRMLHHADDAQDVTQEVFVTVYRKLKTFGFRSSLKTWIYRIATNLAINHAKKREREQNRTVALDEKMESVLASNPADRADVRHAQREQVSALLEVLNADQRACLVLRDFEGLSYEEIAQTLGINLNTVRSRLKRGREKLLAFSKEVIRHEM